MVQQAISTVLETAKPEIDTQNRNNKIENLKSWVETSIWTERMLTALGNGVQGDKWYSLMDKVYNLRTLKAAWKRVASNKGAAGIDRISINKFKAKEEIYLTEISKELKAKQYLPRAVRRVHIPKGNGKTRPLGIPTVKDRIVQMALKMVIEPIFEKEFLEMSYGFRPKRGCKDALREVDKLIKGGYTYIVDADISSYFDTIPHNKLMELIKDKISDSSVLKLIDNFLQQKIMDGLEEWTPIKGTPQGAVLSPLLANLYLHPLDVIITQAGYKMIRYADDFVIMCQNQKDSEAALELVKRWTQANGLNLHPDKTYIGNCSESGQGFDFLGYRFEGGKRFVRTKSLKLLKDKIRQKTKRTRGDGIECIINSLNPMLKGWFEYFKHAGRQTFKDLDGFIRRRLRSILCRHNGISVFGRSQAIHRRWPNIFFAKRGLFTLYEAHVLACQSR